MGRDRFRGSAVTPSSCQGWCWETALGHVNEGTPATMETGVGAARHTTNHKQQGNLRALRALGAVLTCQNCHVKPRKARHFYHLLLKIMHFS